MNRLASLLLLPVLAIASAASAGDFPSHALRVLIPFTAGGQTDLVMRVLAPKLQASLGQPVVIENKPGGGAQIAATALLQAPADGYTLFAAPGGAFALNPTLYKNLSYDPVKDFEGVSTLLTSPMVLFTSPTGRVASVDAFKRALAAGEALNYGSPGQGTAPHLFGYVLGKASRNSRFVHVPYRGAPQMNQAVLAKEIDVAFDALPGVLPLAAAGQVRPLAIAADKRDPLFPDVPTLHEVGLPRISMDYWMGVVVKAGTPPKLVERLHAAFEKALADPAVLAQFSRMGYTRLALSPRQFDELIRSDLDKYRPIVRETGATVD
ncbi:MAG: tripartite tricarboxylate transporter substrate binding protein [Proteobacteria bacterium]|nr:tripartite tricarboxylate transporter substrate binding protein [Pseudomonadota bacterium]